MKSPATAVNAPLTPSATLMPTTWLMPNARLMSTALPMLTALLTLTGCASAPETRDAFASGAHSASLPAGTVAADPDQHKEDTRTQIARLATAMVGVPYRYGGSTPSEGFDCSGLVHYTYSHAGVSVPRTSAELFKASQRIAIDGARAGDLVFFQDQRKLSHVGIWLGDGRFVHAPSSGDTVKVSELDAPYYQQHLVAVGRLLPE